MKRSTFIHLNMLAWILVCLIELQIEREWPDFDVYEFVRRFFIGGILTFVITWLFSLLIRKKKR